MKALRFSIHIVTKDNFQTEELKDLIYTNFSSLGYTIEKLEICPDESPNSYVVTCDMFMEEFANYLLAVEAFYTVRNKYPSFDIIKVEKIQSVYS